MSLSPPVKRQLCVRLYRKTLTDDEAKAQKQVKFTQCVALTIPIYLPCRWTCSTSSSFAPAAARTSDSLTPVHVALLIALVPHDRPRTDLSEAMLLRLLPAHCTAADIV